MLAHMSAYMQYRDYHTCVHIRDELTCAICHFSDNIELKKKTFIVRLTKLKFRGQEWLIKRLNMAF